jgi:hypothetical protein
MISSYIMHRIDIEEFAKSDVDFVKGVKLVALDSILPTFHV